MVKNTSKHHSPYLFGNNSQMFPTLWKGILGALATLFIALIFSVLLSPTSQAYATEGWLTLTKSSSNTALTNGLGSYSLKDAVYGVYSDSSCNTLVTTITTSTESGSASYITLEEGTYYVKEITASTGYQLSSTVYEVTVAAETTTPLQVTDDPITALFATSYKYDADTSATTPQGDATLIGARFQLSYYDVTSVSEAQLTTPTETWILEVDENGILELDIDHLVSGTSFFYLDSNSNIVIPFGVVSWEEVTAPEGYLANDITWITVDGSSASISFDTYDEVIRGGFSVQKYDAETNLSTTQGDANYTGVTISIYNRSENAVVVNGRTYVPGEICYSASLDSTGGFTSASNALPYGTYEMVETNGSIDGAYICNEDWSYTFTITENGTVDTGATALGTGVRDQVVRGGFTFQKYDAETGYSTPQGDGSFAGVQIQLINRSTNAVYVDGTSYDSGAVIATITLDDSAYYASDTDYLPYGTYELVEVSGSTDGSYLCNEDWSYTFTITSDGQIDRGAATVSGGAVTDQVARGGFIIQKYDLELGRILEQGDADYTGVEISVINRSENSVYVDNKVVAPGEVVYVATLDGSGYFNSGTSLLPYGTYELRETKGSDDGSYYANEDWSYTFTITSDGELDTDATLQSTGPNDQILRGGLSVQKFAAEVSQSTTNTSANGTYTGADLTSVLGLNDDGTAISLEDLTVILENAANYVSATGFNSSNIGANSSGVSTDNATNFYAVPQAGAQFEGAEITIYNASTYSVLVDGDVYEPGEAVMTLVLDETGYAETATDALPYGTYTLKETKAPSGYKLNENWSSTVEIREEGVVVEVTSLPEVGDDTAGVDDQIIRGDYSFSKIESETQGSLSYVPFLLINNESGEAHVIVADVNGEFSSNTDWNAHTYNTNANDAAITWNDDGTYTIDASLLDEYAGVWFTGYGPLNDPTGELAQMVDPNDDLGALPYGTYTLIELASEGNEGYDGVVRTFTITRDGHEINGGTITDTPTTDDEVSEGNSNTTTSDDTTTTTDTTENDASATENENTSSDELETADDYVTYDPTDETTVVDDSASVSEDEQASSTALLSQTGDEQFPLVVGMIVVALMVATGAATYSLVKKRRNMG